MNVPLVLDILLVSTHAGDGLVVGSIKTTTFLKNKLGVGVWRPTKKK